VKKILNPRKILLRVKSCIDLASYEFITFHAKRGSKSICLFPICRYQNCKGGGIGIGSIPIDDVSIGHHQLQ